MPTAVMPQPISTAPTSARAAMFCGNEKIPPPTIEPTTSAVSDPRPSLRLPCDMAAPSCGYRQTLVEAGRPASLEGTQPSMVT